MESKRDLFLTIKKIIQLIEKNNKSHLADIARYNYVLKIHHEWSKTNPPHFELAEQMQRIFLDLINMMKDAQESQVKFNKKIIKMMSKSM